MFKLILIALMVVGGYTLCAHFYPQFLGLSLLHISGYTLTGGIALILLLIYAGFKCVSAQVYTRLNKMAKIEKIDNATQFLVLTRYEAMELVCLLIGQLANQPAHGQQSGACPSISIHNLNYRLGVVLEKDF